jgi:hypothetical protein
MKTYRILTVLAVALFFVVSPLYLPAVEQSGTRVVPARINPDLVPESGTIYSLAGGWLYHAPNNEGLASKALGLGWKRANEFVYRTALANDYDLPASRSEMKDGWFEMEFTSKGQKARLLVEVSMVTGAVRLPHQDNREASVKTSSQDFLAKATLALKAVQAAVKDDKILGPLAKAELKQDQGSVTIRTETLESWPNFPSKPRNLERGFGWLRLEVNAELPKLLPGTPFFPPPGCHYGSTWLAVPGTQAKILVESTTSDSGAHRRLVELVAKELTAASIATRPNDPEN